MTDLPGRPASPDDPTLPSRPTTRKIGGMRMNRLAAYAEPRAENGGSAIQTSNAPAILQPYLDGEIDLDAELAARFPNMPLMSLFSTRQVGGRSGYVLATLSTQDGAASLGVQVDSARHTGFAFTLGSMLSLRFHLHDLSDDDRAYWLNLARGGSDALAFLWSQARWESDYLICAVHRMYTNLYAFSPHHVEAAARCTPEVTRRLLDWLETAWSAPAPVEDAPSPLHW